MIALIDFDSALFFAGCKNSEGEVYSSLQSLFYTMINNTGATEYIVALTTGHNTFRHKLYPEYKANRKSKVLPENLKLAREYAHEFNPITNPDLEADDIISLYKHKYQDDAIICSPDSDFTTIPGKHYDYKKHTFYDVNPFEAEYNLYRYMKSCFFLSYFPWRLQELLLQSFLSSYSCYDRQCLFFLFSQKFRIFL